MGSKELEKVNSKYDIVAHPATREKNPLSFVDVVVTPLMVSSPVVATTLVGMYLHPALAILVAPVALFGSALWSGIRAVKAQYNTTQHHEKSMIENEKKYSSRNLLVPVNYSENNNRANLGISNRILNSLQSIVSGKIGDYGIPKIKFGKLFKSLLTKQEIVHVTERNGWAVANIYKYRFMRLVEVEEHVFISPEIEWEKGFTLCVEVTD